MRAASLVALLALFSVVAVVAGEEEASVLADTEEVQYSRCEFQFPDLKRFFKERIEKGHFANTHMQYISGRVPELIVYDSNGAEHTRLNVEGKSVDELKELLASFGFNELGEKKEEL